VPKRQDFRFWHFSDMPVRQNLLPLSDLLQTRCARRELFSK
jgi:hypothetical protein